VGAHIGSLEYDVAEAAKRFDRYPNFAIDTSARLLDIALQDTQKVRQFFLDYQDRILFGTDIVTPFPMSALSEEKCEQILSRYRSNYLDHFRYLETNDTFEIHGRIVTGIGLPPDVLEKVYYGNALRWYPGVD
jgi:predicted TIM-barrel fold metal-dependent hydrolase